MIVFLLIFVAGLGFFQYMIVGSLWNSPIFARIMPVLSLLALLGAWLFFNDEAMMYTVVGLFGLTFALALLGIIGNALASLVQGVLQRIHRQDKTRTKKGLPPLPWWRKAGSALIMIGAPIVFFGSFFVLGPAGFFLIFFIGPLFMRFLKSRNPHSFIKLQEILPTSRIRSVANGLAEVEGRLLPGDDVLAAPLDESPCIAYRYKVEKQYTDSDGDTRYTTVTDRTQCADFFIADKTGKMAVSSEELELLWLPLSSQYSQNGRRYTQYLLEEGHKMLLIGHAKLGADGTPRMVKHALYDIFTMAPAAAVGRYNKYRPLINAGLMYLGLLGLLVALILITPMDINNGQLFIGRPNFGF